MSMQTDNIVQKTIVVETGIDHAFEVFTAGMSSWWPPEHHLISDIAEIVFEPRVGGHIFDRSMDGTESHWARVLAYDPPIRLVFSWNVSLQWELETDPQKTSEVEVRFVPESATRTRVELVHRKLERHGEGWQQMHEAVSGDGGWSVGLQRFADRVRA